MDIPELLRKRDMLEQRMKEALNALHAQFKEETGLSLSRIDVEMDDTTSFGDRTRAHIVGRVNVEMAVK